MSRSGSPYSAPRDANRVPMLIAASTADGVTPVVLEADPTTHLLQVSSTGGGGGTQYTDGASAPTHPIGTATEFVNGSGNWQTVSTANPLPITGSISVGSTTDNTAFTAGSSTTAPAAGVYNDSLTALSSGFQGTLRSTAYRGLHTNLRNNSGTEIGTATTPIQVSLANTATNSTAIKVDGSAVTQPVSGTVTANAGTGTMAVSLATNTPTLQSGSTTAVTQATGTNLHTVVDSGTVTANISGSISNTSFAATQATASSLNATVVGTGTFAVQATDNITQIGGSSLALGQTTKSASLPVTLASDQGSLIAVGGTASGSSLTAAPITVGGLAKTALPTAVADGQVVNAMGDKFGRQVVHINGMRDLILPMTQLTLTATTAETTLIAQTASVFNDILSLVVINTSATATQVDFRDSTSGTVRLSLYVPAGDTRGITLPNPLPQAAVNTNWTAKCGTSVSSVIITGTYITNK